MVIFRLELKVGIGGIWLYYDIIGLRLYWLCKDGFK